ncbi:hypothetical protein Tco_0990378 [Tanacetum coccineum]|uniref:Uncharacterized protein n=1 Tax=Tanacetum coccineum TaxID=301880 RepID=A0ABQ5EWH4_9ASTR
MNGVISGRDGVIVVASVLIGGGVTSEEGLGYKNSVKGAITGGVDVTVLLEPLGWLVWSSQSLMCFSSSGTPGLVLVPSRVDSVTTVDYQEPLVQVQIKDVRIEFDMPVDIQIRPEDIHICVTGHWNPKRKDTQVPQPSDPIENVADESVHKELGDSLVRVATTASSLEAEQDSGNINKTQSKATPNESSSLGTTSGGDPRCQETMGDTIVETRFENVSKHFNDSLLITGNTLRSDEDRLKLDELMALCTTLQNRVLDLEKTKTTQHNEIASLKRRVKKLEKKNRSRTHRLKRLYKGRIDAIDADEEITMASVQNVDEEMFDVNVLDGEEVFCRGQGKGILIDTVKPMNKKDLIRLDEETALNLQAEFDEEERLARENAQKEEEANIALIETWDDIQAKIDADHQLAERMQAQEQEELSIEKKATLFQQLLEKRRKHFAAKRAEEKRSKPQIKAQQRKIIAFKRVNTFEDFRTELVEGKEKRAGTELVEEITKKQKVEDDKETTELKQLMKILPDEDEVQIDQITFGVAVKSP